MKILRYFASIILSFLILIIVFLIIASNIFNSIILNKNYILSKMEETEFNLQLSREVESGFENYIYQSVLPKETITELFTEDMIKEDVNSLINALYEGTEISLNEDLLRENLSKRIEEYIISENMNLNEQGKSNIKEFEDLIVNEYINNVNVSEELYIKGNTLIKQLQDVSNKVGNIPTVILIVLIIILLLINITDLLVAVNFLGIAALTVGILLKAITNSIFTQIDIDNLVVLATSLSNLIITIIKENLYKLSDHGNVFIVCGIIGILISATIKNTTKKRKRLEINKL